MVLNKDEAKVLHPWVEKTIADLTAWIAESEDPKIQEHRKMVSAHVLETLCVIDEKLRKFLGRK